MKFRIPVLMILSLLAAVTLLTGTGISPASAIPMPSWKVLGVAYIDNLPAGTGYTIYAKSDAGVTYISCGTTSSTTQNYSLSIPARSSDPPVVGAIDGETIHLFIDTAEVATVQYQLMGDPLTLRLDKYTTSFSVSLAAPTNQTSTSVTLNAVLNGLGSNGSVNLTFAYGPTYGNIVTATPPIRTLPGSFSAIITGLAANTTYTYKAVATGVTIASASGSFTTLAPTLTVSTDAASSITTASATISGTLSDLGVNSSVNVSFLYGTSTTPTTPSSNQLMTAVGSFSYPMTGLAAGTTYYFQAKAVGSTTVFGPVNSFRTASASGGCTTMCCHRFWGTAYSGSSPIANASIIAYANGIQKQTATANPNGTFNLYVPISGGETISFTVNGASAAESISGQCMGVNYDSQQPFDLHITSTLIITDASPLTAATVNVAYTKTFSAIGGSSTGRTWSLLSRGTLPVAFSLSTGGVLTGTQTSAGGPYSFTVQVNDSLGTPASKDFMLTVNPVGTLSITTTSPLTAATVNVAYSQTFAASGGSGSGRTWTLSDRGTLPAVFTLSIAGVLTGTATSAGGPYSFTVQVTDSFGVPASGVFQLTVNTVSTLSITTASPLTAATVNVAYSQTFAATGGSGTGRTWSLLSRGTLPVAFSLSTGGVLTGTATSAGGPYSFTVQVTDSLGVPATKDFQLTCSSSGSTCGADPIGCTVGDTLASWGQYSVALCEFPAKSTTTINKLNLITSGPDGNVRVAIYTESGTRLGASVLTPVTAGLNSITITPGAAITNGTNYWLASWSDGPLRGVNKDAGVYKFISGSSDFTFPASIDVSAPSGLLRGLISGSN